MRCVCFNVAVLLTWCCALVLALDPMTTGLGAGVVAVGSVVWFKAVCMFRECCEDPYIRSYPYGLEEAMDKNLFGQHIAKSVVFKSLQSHLRKFEPKKALVLSFHGMTGSGKNYVSQLIAESLFKEGMKSKYVHVYASKVHFPEKGRVEFYKNKIQSEIKEKVKNCARSLFVFDEVDELDPGIIDGIKPFLDYYPNIDGVDYRRAIFIFLSNSGASGIYNLTLKNWKDGKKRETLSLEMFDQYLNSVAFNNEGGLWRADIIDRALVDAAVPFLPLEKEHVKLCIRAEIDKQSRTDKEKEMLVYSVTDEEVAQLAERRTYDESGIFSTMGCKKLETLVAVFLE